MKETDFCKICRYYLYLEEVPEDKEKQEPAQLQRICRNCGHTEPMEGGLILEIDLKEKTSEGYKILMNEFTKQDPTLPHVHTLHCPAEDCPSNRYHDVDIDEKSEDVVTEPKITRVLADDAVESDIIYLKYDAVNMKYLYICNVCGEKWRSKA